MNLLNIKQLSRGEINHIFDTTDRLKRRSYSKLLEEKTFVMFFPNTSIRTRLAFEKAIKSLGGECVLFPPETLDKREALQDVMKYIENFADGVIIRHKEYDKLEELANWSQIPIINAMTFCNHPLEILSDVYTISRLKDNFNKLSYTFVGENGNICKSWVNIAGVLDLKLNHVCKDGYQFKIDDVNYNFNTELDSVLRDTDVVLTDALPKELKTSDYIKQYQITLERMKQTKEGAILNPCPPFYRGEEVSADVIESGYFVGHQFKENLVYVKQAVLLYCLGIELD